MTPTKTSREASDELANEMEVLSKIAVVHLLVAERDGNTQRAEYWGDVVDGYIELAILLDNLERDLVGLSERSG